MICDVTTYNGEKDLWDIHYNVLKDVVDEFIVIEFAQTFSGRSKDIELKKLNTIAYPKAKFVVHTPEKYEKYRLLAESSQNTQGADHWKREFMQKESIKDALGHLKDEDTVIIGDVDEIIDLPKSVLDGYFGPIKLKLDVYTYYLNNRSSEEFWGPIVGRWGNIKDKCLNHVRTNSTKAENPTGWHFTSMGGPLSLRKKLTDSYTEESYATPEVLARLEENYGDKDFLGRNFTYTRDESSWPQYLKQNRARYAHLLATA